MGESFVVDRTGRGLLRLTGPQRVWFLENTITASVEGLEEGTWTESCFLTPKGKLVSHFRVGVGAADDHWLDVDPPADQLADWFVRYRFRTKVEIDDRATTVSTVVGDAASELAPPGQVRVVDGAVVFGDRLGDVPTADVHGGAELVADLPPRGPDAYDLVRIEAGVAAFGVDYTTDNLPQEAGLTRVAPVDKGCYVGQETVARIHFRGHANKVVRPLRFEGDAPAVGTALLQDDAPLGTVTSSVHSPRLGPVGIGMLRLTVEEGAEVDVEGGGSAVVGPIPEGTKVSSPR